MTVPLRAALYLRVSTARQAEHDISIPDQRRQGEAYCAARGHQLVETFVEPGSTATNDRRPEFQRMIESGSASPLRSTSCSFIRSADSSATISNSSSMSASSPRTASSWSRSPRRSAIAGGGYRRDHLRALAQRVEVADGEVRIMGSKGGLLRTLAAAAGVKSPTVGVRSSVPKWRPVGDSNPCYRRERAVSWASRRTGPGQARLTSASVPATQAPPPGQSCLSNLNTSSN